MELTSPPIVRCLSTDGLWAFEITESGSVTVGRDPRRAQVVIPYNALAREHVRFRNEAGVCVVEYANAPGNILVNGEIIREPRRPLQPGDYVTLLPGLVFEVQSANRARDTGRSRCIPPATFGN